MGFLRRKAKDTAGEQTAAGPPPKAPAISTPEAAGGESPFGTEAPDERIARARSLAASSNYKLPPGINRDMVIAALAQPGDPQVPLQLIKAYDAEQDDVVRTEIFRELLGIVINLRERAELAAVSGVELRPEDRSTLELLEAESTRIVAEHQAKGAG